MFYKWILRKGNVGGTVRWVVRGYNEILQQDRSLSLKEVIKKLIIARCSVMTDESELNMLLQLSEQMMGLKGLVMSLLCTEASYLENTDEGKKLIMQVVDEELLKSGLGIDILFGKKLNMS